MPADDICNKAAIKGGISLNFLQFDVILTKIKTTDSLSVLG